MIYSKSYLLVISTDKERSTLLREVASGRHPTLSEDQREMDEGHGMVDARMQPVVKLYRIGLY